MRDAIAVAGRFISTEMWQRVMTDEEADALAKVLAVADAAVELCDSYAAKPGCRSAVKSRLRVQAAVAALTEGK